MTFDRADFYDAELRRHNEHFRAAVAASPRDRVLDIGCGAGQSTRDVARVASHGSATGVDVSEAMLRVARRRSAAEGLRNVEFIHGDARTLAFPDGHFDLCISRFGAMFFADPVSALTHIGRAMRPGARLVLMAWQGRRRNEWATAIPEAVTPGADPSADAARAFAFGEPAFTRGILAEAGFGSVEFTEVHEPVFYGPTPEAAFEAVVELFLPKPVHPIPAEESAETHRRIRALLADHLTAEGVLFDSRAWIVTARARSRRCG